MARKTTPNAEAQRARVLEASIEIFSRQGYRGTTMNDVAAEVGLGKPSLYHYFSSKEEILIRLYENVVAEGVAEAQAVVDRIEDPLEAYRQLLIDRVVYTCEHRDLLKVFFEEEGELPKRLAKTLIQRRTGFEGILKSAVNEHLDRTGITLPCSVSVYVNTCLGAVNWTYKWFDPAGSLTPSELGAQIADTLITPLRSAAAGANGRGKSPRRSTAAGRRRAAEPAA